MKLLECNSKHGKVVIPISKITGICEPSPTTIDSGYRTFIATGADGTDGEENGWYVTDEFSYVHTMLENAEG